MKLILFCLFSFSVFAEDCPTIHLDKNGGPVEKIPIYDQSTRYIDPEICSDIATAVVIDAYRSRYGRIAAGEFTAPLSIASHQHAASMTHTEIAGNHDDPKLFDYEALGTALVIDAMQAAKGIRVCNEGFLSSFDGLVGPRDPKMPAAPGAFIEAMISGAKSFREYSENMRQWTDDQNAYILNPYFQCGIAKRATSPVTLIGAVAQAAEQTSRPEMADMFLKTLCRGHDHKIDFPNPNFLNRETMRIPGNPKPDKSLEFRKAISAQLLPPNSMPVAISFCGIVLSNPQGGAVQDYPYKLPSVCGNHASVVVGQRYDVGRKKCQFLVRDGYGKDCGREKVNISAQWKCENGGLWIDQAPLSDSIFNTVDLPAK
jgi:hypothetical protein